MSRETLAAGARLLHMATPSDAGSLDDQIKDSCCLKLIWLGWFRVIHGYEEKMKRIQELQARLVGLPAIAHSPTEKVPGVPSWGPSEISHACSSSR